MSSRNRWIQNTFQDFYSDHFCTFRGVTKCRLNPLARNFVYTDLFRSFYLSDRELIVIVLVNRLLYLAFIEKPIHEYVKFTFLLGMFTLVKSWAMCIIIRGEQRRPKNKYQKNFPYCITLDHYCTVVYHPSRNIYTTSTSTQPHYTTSTST